MENIDGKFINDNRLLSLPTEMLEEISLRCELQDLPRFIEAVNPRCKPNKFLWEKYLDYHNEYSNHIIMKLDFITYYEDINYDLLIRQLIGYKHKFIVEDIYNAYGIRQNMFNTMIWEALSKGMYETLKFVLKHKQAEKLHIIKWLNEYNNVVSNKCKDDGEYRKVFLSILLHPYYRRFGPYHELCGLRKIFIAYPDLKKEYLDQLTEEEKNKKLINKDDLIIHIDINHAEVLLIPKDNIDYYNMCLSRFNTFTKIIHFDKYIPGINYKSVHNSLLLFSPYIINFTEGSDTNGYYYNKGSFLFYLALFNMEYNIVRLMSRKQNIPFISTILYNNCNDLFKLLENSKILKIIILTLLLFKKEFALLRTMYFLRIPELTEDAFANVKKFKFLRDFLIELFGIQIA